MFKTRGMGNDCKIAVTAGQFAQYPVINETPAKYCVNFVITFSHLKDLHILPGTGRQCSLVVRALDLKSLSPGFRPHSYH